MLQNTGTHPSADWIYEKIKIEFKNLSMGTVYRNLSILVKQGLINKIDFGSTFDRYDANTSRHYHHICEKCGLISDLEIPFDENLNGMVTGGGTYTAHHHRIEFYGLCDKCKR